jgi:MFS family permease
MSFWAGETISQFGDRISELALPLIAVVTLAATPTQVGLLTAAIWAPNVLSLLVGTWVDQVRHKKRLLVAADLLRALVLLSLPIAAWAGWLSLGHLFVIAVLTGLGQVLFSTAYPTFFVGLVDRSQYVEANSKVSGTRSMSFVVGPAVGGWLVQVFTAPVAVLLDAVSFVASAVLIGRIPVPDAPPASGEGSTLTRAREGLGYVMRHRTLRASLACVTTVNLFTFMAQALVVLFASRTLGLSPGVIGLAFGIGALGGVLGAVVATRLGRRFGIGRMAVLGAIMFPAPIALLALAGGPTPVAAAVLGVAEFLSGAGVMMLDINLNAIQTAATADAVRSRVAGVFGSINYGVRPLGAVAGGLLGDHLGVRPTLVVAGIGGALCFLWLLPSAIPSFRTVDDVV